MYREISGRGLDMRLAVVTMDDGAVKSRTNNTVARDYDLQGQSFEVVDYI